eukprot:3049880-Alexandrium_andersonii.AAC.1
MELSEFRRFGAAERAVWPVGRAGTAAPSGWTLGPELALTRGQSDCLGAPTYEYRKCKITSGVRNLNCTCTVP